VNSKALLYNRFSMRFAAFLLFSVAAFAALPLPPAFVLPDDVVPKKYFVDLTIDPAKETFEGLRGAGAD
jgi:hypothetical protein